MKRVLMLIGVVSGILIFMGTNVAFSQDAPKSGCQKQACFERMDADKSGQVTETEFIENCKNRFSSMDADKSGSLSKDEFKSCCMKHMSEKACPFKKQYNEK